MESIQHVQSDAAYAKFEHMVWDRIKSLQGPLFTTSVADLPKMYLDGIDHDRQHYNCNHCKRFIDRFGGLATIDKLGKVESALWADDYPTFFRHSTETMREAVIGAKIIGVLMNEDAVWGSPKTGEWSHLSGTPQLGVVPKAGQMAAEKRQDYIMLSRGLVDYGVDVVREALRVLEADALDRSEKTLGVARWLLALIESIDGRRGRDRQNLIWLAVATAPPGFCHIRTTMISTLLTDITEGLKYEEVAARWSEKMHPLQYQRPTAPLKDGQIATANKLVEEMQFAGSLDRRFAKLEEIQQAIWRPAPPLGVPTKHMVHPSFFNHLKREDKVEPLALKVVKMTWSRFREQVLPKAHELELCAPSEGAYYGMVTAVNADAPPILQWDAAGRRNPVSWFFFYMGSRAREWNLTPLQWVKVNAVCDKPCHWYSGHEHHKPAAFLILEGAHLLDRQSHGGFFPECLRAELRQIRPVMEAYAKRHAVQGASEGTANGYCFQKGQEYDVTIRVNGTDLYLIDRWE